MAGEGSMLHTINTLKNNRNLRRSKRRKFRNQNSSSLNYGENPIVTLKISDEKLQIIKKKIRLRIKKDKRKNLIMSSILFSIVALLLLYFWRYLF